MTSRFTRVAVGVLFATAASAALVSPAAASPPPGASVSSKRQVSDCMSRRMASARTLSYNEANKLCKDEVSALPRTAILRPSSKPVGAH